MNSKQFIKITLIVLVISACAYANGSLFAQDIQTSTQGLVTRVAPGQSLPFLVKLLNFGSNRRADVTVTYRIINKAGAEVYSETETVAVDTTASFIKYVQIPTDLSAGTYAASASIVYGGQAVPATSKFSFSVEPTLFGFFTSDLLAYGGIGLFAVVLTILFARWIFISRPRRKFAFYDYRDKPKAERIYYEIISDTISEMRLRAGDMALAMAGDIPDLEIDPENGKVLAFKKDPAKILALLVLRYETLLGRRVAIAPRAITYQQA